jgi:hypothetical protein
MKAQRGQVPCPRPHSRTDVVQCIARQRGLWAPGKPSLVLPKCSLPLRGRSPSGVSCCVSPCTTGDPLWALVLAWPHNGQQATPGQRQGIQNSALHTSYAKAAGHQGWDSDPVPGQVSAGLHPGLRQGSVCWAQRRPVQREQWCHGHSCDISSSPRDLGTFIASAQSSLMIVSLCAVWLQAGFHPLWASVLGSGQAGPCSQEPDSGLGFRWVLTVIPLLPFPG